MTTEALRKVIKVTNWQLTKAGLKVSYEREGSKPTILHLILNQPETLRELYAVGSIEEINEPGLMAFWNNCWYYFEQIPDNYKMCQWEALEIAIRYEAIKELDSDMNMLRFDAALAALRE
jgi:hypothetical protein